MQKINCRKVYQAILVKHFAYIKISSQKWDRIIYLVSICKVVDIIGFCIEKYWKQKRYIHLYIYLYYMYIVMFFCSLRIEAMFWNHYGILIYILKWSVGGDMIQNLNTLDCKKCALQPYKETSLFDLASLIHYTIFWVRNMG